MNTTRSWGAFAALAALALSSAGCLKAADTEEVLGTVQASGTVLDSKGNRLAGATVKIWAITDLAVESISESCVFDPKAGATPAERRFDPARFGDCPIVIIGQSRDRATYRLLPDNFPSPLGTATTNEQGRYVMPDIAKNLYVAMSFKTDYADGVAGIDPQTSQFTTTSAITLAAVDATDVSIPDLVMAGGPLPVPEPDPDQGNVGQVPEAQPAPDPALPPPADQCQADADCAGDPGAGMIWVCLDSGGTNVCTAAPAPGCRAVADCDDGDAATTDECLADGTCVHYAPPQPVDECTDGTSCETLHGAAQPGNRWVCDASGAATVCVEAAIPPECTADLDCDDADLATADTCTEDGKCTHVVPPPPPPVDECATETDCETANGPAPAGEQWVCVASATGATVCVTAPLPPECTSDADCDDFDAATTDTCATDQTCVHYTPPVPTDECATAADCETARGPASAGNIWVCAQGDAILICTEALDPDCNVNPSVCDDGDATTTDECQPDGTCLHVPPPPPPDPNELQPPELGPVSWESFKAYDFAEAELGDASNADAEINTALSTILAEEPIVLFRGKLVGSTSTEPTRAFLRVQTGASGCTNQAPTTELIPLTLDGEGNISSEKGDFVEVPLTGGWQVFQLASDDTADAQVSHLMTVGTRCQLPEHELTIILTWDTDGDDVDLHIWSQGSGGHISADHNRKDHFGQIDVDDTDGFGPETFTSNEESRSGVYSIRLRHYRGAGHPTATVRVIQTDLTSCLRDDTFVLPIQRVRDWVDVGTFTPAEICAGATP